MFALKKPLIIINIIAFILIVIIVAIVTLYKMTSPSEDNYLDERNTILKAEKELKIGGKLSLSANEQILNATLMSYKAKEIKDARSGDGFLLSSKNFVHIRHLLGDSDVYQMIKRMPKGGMLHLHDLSMTSTEWLIEFATYRTDCYMCVTASTNHTLFCIRNRAPVDTEDCKWSLVADERRKAENISEFDLGLSRRISIVDYASMDLSKQTQQQIWKTFDRAFTSMVGLVFHPEIFSPYFYRGLEELYKDGGNYAELRTLLGPIIDSDGKEYEKDWSVKEYIKIAKEFKEKHSDFIGVKLIYCAHRSNNDEGIKDSVLEAIDMMKMYPDMIIGYDLVGREDSGRPLIELLEQLLILPQQQNVTLPFYFHAGETDWQDTDVDDNLLDAALLHSKRIGHGFALLKHPVTMAKLKENRVAVELNPISNQVLLLVSDLRNHPGAVLLANDYPCVIGSDDPGMWHASPITDDYYATFMALLGARGDLASLKQLFLNSIEFSGMQPEEKTKAFEVYKISWDRFVEEEVSRIKYT